MKTCHIIAGPNGAGKTTFAKSFLPKEGNCINFINVDLIAAGLSPFAPDKVSIKAGRLMLQQIQACVLAKNSFSFETTLAGMRYASKINSWKKVGYTIILYFLKLPSVEIAIDRVRKRVLEGGHNVPQKDIERRFLKGWNNFSVIYKDIVDYWMVFDTSESAPKLIERSP